ncbi:cysteine desufuration protein SufE [Iodidimonas nitroreducens]|uniref:Cysteine desufuration protein SufE n=2 Tax=Iodidimonas nitroreducens TaxID=1236968 RepID=A0A5A7N875_9PROT|nr:SufE family protein [Iodidimonas nitroreducens]GAK33695.1 putative SufE-like protein [alpha proteobacterium Q-1]GER03590.1 cysteine desufuration protein SufE [Iodidimonas nitroreducens]
MTQSQTLNAQSPSIALGDTDLQMVRDSFDLMDDWEDRYRYIIDLGRKLPKLPEDAYREENKVRGCTSQVWLVARLDEDGADQTADETGPRLYLAGDSDAHIVKGLVALMLLIFSGKSPDAILDIDARAILDDLGLRQHLSPMRANGLFSMLERIRDMAQAAKA